MYVVFTFLITARNGLWDKHRIDTRQLKQFKKCNDTYALPLLYTFKTFLYWPLFSTESCETEPRTAYVEKATTVDLRCRRTAWRLTGPLTVRGTPTQSTQSWACRGQRPLPTTTATRARNENWMKMVGTDFPKVLVFFLFIFVNVIHVSLFLYVTLWCIVFFVGF